MQLIEMLVMPKIHFYCFLIALSMLTLTERIFKQNYTVTVITPLIYVIVFQMKLTDTDLG